MNWYDYKFMYATFFAILGTTLLSKSTDNIAIPLFFGFIFTVIMGYGEHLFRTQLYKFHCDYIAIEKPLKILQDNLKELNN